MPTINIQTIGTGRMHTTLVAFATWLQARDLVGNDEMVHAHVYDDQTITGACALTPLTYSKSNGCRITPAPGLGVNDLDVTGGDYGSAGVEIIRTSASQIFRVGYGVALEGFRIRINGTSTSTGIYVTRRANSSTTDPHGVNDARFAKNRVLHQNTGGGSAISCNNNGTAAIIEDNIFINESTNGYLISGGYYIVVQRNTFIGRGTGQGLTAINNVSSGAAYYDNVFHNCGATPVLRTTNTKNCLNNYTNTSITGTADGFTTISPVIASETNARLIPGSALVGKASEYAYDTTDIVGAYRGRAPDPGAFMVTSQPLPAKPDATITGIFVAGQKVTVTGSISGPTNSATADLLPASVPNGAVEKSGTIEFSDDSFTAVFEAVAPGNYKVPQIRLTNVGGTGVTIDGAAVVVARPPVPGVTITSQATGSQALTIYGNVTGYPLNGTVTLPAAAINPGGAVTKVDVPITILDEDNSFSVTITSVNPGSYDAPTVTVSNGSGSGSAIGSAVLVYANGSLKPGEAPAVILDPYQVPAFNSSTLSFGDVVTSVKIENTTANAITNVPFTFGQPIKKSQLMPSDKLVGKISGKADVPLQFNVKNTFDNGSIRFGIISGILPALAANETIELQLVRSATTATTLIPAISSDLITNGFDAIARLDIGGVTYTASPKAILTNGTTTAQMWLKGSIATDWIIQVPFTTAAGVEHPDMTAQFSVRYYPSIQAAKVDVAVEHTKAYTGVTAVLYDATLSVGGTTVYTKSGIANMAGARWMKSFWWNSTAGKSIHIGHTPKYFIETKAVPNYDQRVVVRESVLAGFASFMTDPKLDPMRFGKFAQAMGGTGGRPELGLTSQWTATYILSADKRAKDFMLAHASICAGSWTTHLRDVSGGPGHGYPLSLIYFPAAGMTTDSDSRNPATGLSERVKTPTNGQDTSHQSNMAYVPYLVTGDYYYLEEMQFWCHWNLYSMNAGYRKRVLGLFNRGQVRGVAWTMRTMAECAAFTPDDHPQKMAFKYWLDNTLQSINATFTDNPAANKLGAYTPTDGAVIYSGPITKEGGSAIGNFQDDFITQAAGHAGELGFPEAKRFMQWKATYQIGRINAPGVCFAHAAIYALQLRPNVNSPWYNTLAECYAVSIDPILLTMPCNSPERIQYMNDTRGLPSNAYVTGGMTGYPDSATGFGANLQPALAMCVDGGHPDGLMAWEIYESREPKQNYYLAPQFAIVPRAVTERIVINATGTGKLPRK